MMRMRLRIRRSVRPLTLCGALVLLPCLLAACGTSARPTASGAPSTVTRTVTQTRQGSAGTTAGTSGPVTTSTPTTSTPPQPGAGRCVAAGLALSFLGGNGATGHAELGFALRNEGAHSCRTGGYPGVLFLDGSGQGLPTHPVHTTHDFFGQTTLRELTVAPGAEVSFRLGVSHVGSGGSDAGCLTVPALQVIAPDDTATMRVALHGGIAECGGAVTVSPLQPGTTAFH
jgi:uncharacterized protein DUF4232